jgi:hypothetical protein
MISARTLSEPALAKTCGSSASVLYNSDITCLKAKDGDEMKHARIFRAIATIVLVMTAIFWLFKGLADVFTGVRGGINNLLVAIGLLLMVLIGWKKLLWGGIIIALLGVILAVYFNFTLPDINSAFIPLLLICTPMVLGGLLYIEADWALKKRE